MNRPLSTQAVCASLAVLITVCTLWALNAMAGSEHASAHQQLAATATVRV